MERFNKVHFVPYISFCLNYAINDKVQLFGQPTIRYHLTKLSDAPISEYLNNFGIELGIRKRI